MSDETPPARCATCGSEKISTPEVVHDGDVRILVRKVCVSCGTAWTDCYKFEKSTDYTPTA